MCRQISLQQGAYYSWKYHDTHNTQRIIIYYLSTVNIATVRDQYCFHFYLRDFIKNWQNVPLYIELQWYSYFCYFLDWNIFHHFPHKFRICAFFVFSVKKIEAVKEFHKYRFFNSIYRTTLHLLFVGNHVRKNTFQCLSTIKFQPGSN